MKHTSLYLDEKLLERASRILGTQGPTGTVRAALEDVVRRAQRAALASWEPNLAPTDLDRIRATRSS